ncbi:MAG: helix-turn-helix domain-containing protein [Firmicutes bacterium]|nr:helix-turn-helix domain-containing protein [Bacillota bacterium]
MKTIGERIKHLRNNMGLSMAGLEKAINAATGNVNNWEKNRRIPNGNNIIALSNFFNVSSDWLLTGKESRFTETEIKILQLFKDFSRPEQEELENYILFLLWRREKEKGEKIWGKATKKTKLYDTENNNLTNSFVSEDDKE